MRIGNSVYMLLCDSMDMNLNVWSKFLAVRYALVGA